MPTSNLTLIVLAGIVGAVVSGQFDHPGTITVYREGGSMTFRVSFETQTVVEADQFGPITRRPRGEEDQCIILDAENWKCFGDRQSWEMKRGEFSETDENGETPRTESYSSSSFAYLSWSFDRLRWDFQRAGLL